MKKLIICSLLAVCLTITLISSPTLAVPPGEPGSVSEALAPIWDAIGKINEWIDSFTESDPVFDVSVAADITAEDVDNWNASSTGTLKQLVHDFTVMSGQDITAGDAVNFVDGYVRKGLFSGILDVSYGEEYGFDPAYVGSIAVLSPTKFVLTYTLVAGQWYAIIGDIANGAITFGPGSMFVGYSMMNVSITALSSSKFVVTYTDEFGQGTAIIGDVSGNTITYGAEYIFNSSIYSYNSVAALSPDKFVVAYSRSGGITAIIGDVSGNTITYGAEYVFNSSAAIYLSVTALSPDKFVAAYSDGGNLDYGTAIIGDVSGNTITYGAEYVFNNAYTAEISAAALSPDKFVTAYSDGGNLSYGTAIIGNVSGNTIAYGAEYVFDSYPDYHGYKSVAALSPDKFVVAYRDFYNAAFGTTKVGVISDSHINYGSDIVFKSDDSRYFSTIAISPTKFIVAYTDIYNDYIGTARIGDVTYSPFGGNMIGIAKESKTAGEIVPVIIGGVSDVHSGLTPGIVYYASESGDLTSAQTDHKVGLAISETEILLSGFNG